ncbi:MULTISPECIES: adenylate kinase [Edaphocola]|jgi:adenylate kinase|uniref:adenylate kinase n=1 Tax=Edaphocola TaxID=2601681 RepID=UPI00100A7C85|nr:MULTISPECIES: adenylate kinase [Edaphocola]
MFNLILFGPPGSGKGTQSTNLIQTYGLQHLSTGDLLRDEISRETNLGLEAKKFMDAGQLVPDAVVIGMIGSKLDEHPNTRGFIFDGFPRTTAQAEALDNLLALKKTNISVLLSLEVPEEELKQRLVLRGEVSGRSDDNEEVIQKRIAEYKAKTEPVANYYETQGKLERIKGVGTIEEIFGLLRNQVEKFILPQE